LDDDWDGPRLASRDFGALAAGAFGFLIFTHAFDGPDLYGASSLPIRSAKIIAPSRGIVPKIGPALRF
jgi:hypothetical protein